MICDVSYKKPIKLSVRIQQKALSIHKSCLSLTSKQQTVFSKPHLWTGNRLRCPCAPQLTRTFLCSIFSQVAQMAELVDALGSGPSGSNTVQVRVLFWAKLLIPCNIWDSNNSIKNLQNFEKQSKL